MKKNLATLSLTILLAFLSATSFAQNDEPEVVTHHTPKWVSAMGYWMVEGNINTPKHNIVYFYNNDNVLVYKETIDGVVLKLDKRRTKMKLKKLVDERVLAYVQKKTVAQNETLVMNAVK